jgi:hypothetical protein
MSAENTTKSSRLYWTWSHCIADGRSHAVTDEEFAQGVARQDGCYLALCGHKVLIGSCLAPLGRTCPECDAYVQAHKALMRELEDRLSARQARGGAGLPRVVARLVAGVLASGSPVIPWPRSGGVPADAASPAGMAGPSTRRGREGSGGRTAPRPRCVPPGQASEVDR